MKRNTSGIYIIKNTINDKVYIGSAVCLKQRFIGHKNQFKKQAHSVRFQNFVNKYGFNTLIFEVIEYVNDKGKLIEREQYWIDYYESWKSKKGFNICKIAGSTLGLKMPMSHIDSCINRMKGNTYRQGRKWSEKEKIEIGERSREMWKNNPEKKKEMAKKVGDLKRGLPIWNGNKPHPMKGKVHPNRKYILVFKNEILIDECYGTADVCNKYGLDRGNVSRVCNGKLKTTKGYVLRYK